MDRKLEEIKKRERWLKDHTGKVEFSHILDIFRDDREDIRWLIEQVEHLRHQLKINVRLSKWNDEKIGNYRRQINRLNKQLYQTEKYRKALEMLDKFYFDPKSEPGTACWTCDLGQKMDAVDHDKDCPTRLAHEALEE